jgi:hypothetical protein
MDKKASEKINAAMFLLYLVIIAAGVTLLISSYVNAPVEIRPLESRILYEKIMDCIVEDGFLKEEVLINNFDVYSKCHINKTVINNSKIFFEFKFLNETGIIREPISSELSSEFKSRKEYCEIISNTKTPDAIACLYRNESYFYLDKGIKSVKISGWVASFNHGVRNA